MLKQMMLLLSILLLAVIQVKAHDSCGCSANQGGVGLMANFRNNSLSLSWFGSNYQSTYALNEPTKDYFRTLELNFNYYVLPRLRVSAVVPYQWNARQEEGQWSRLDGLSDIRLHADYVVLNNIKCGSNTSLYWDLGIGTKIPLGKYNDNLSRQHLPDNFNPGKGSWGYGFRSSAVFTYASIGLLFSANHWRYKATSQRYQFGDEWNAGLWLFGDIKWIDQLKVSPYISVQYEKVAQNTDSGELLVHGTGGKAYFGSAGFNLQWKKQWLLGIAYAHPLDQSFSDNLVLAKDRFSINLTYFLK